jgi:hypothetical protein
MTMVPNWHNLLSIFALLLCSVASEVIIVGDTASSTFSRRSTAQGDPLVMNGPSGSDSTLKNPSALRGDVAGDAGVVPVPALAYQLFVRFLAVWGILLACLVKARKRKERALQAAIHESTKHVTRSKQLMAECSADKALLYREVIDGYSRLKNGTASTGEVDELRRSARSLLEGRDGQVQYELQEVRELLDWLDNARTSGRISITVQQLRERKMGSWDIECGIDAGGQTIKARKNVNGNAEVDGCVLNVPWDANGGIKVWMHLTDSGYETCWGHFGPIAMSSAEVLQDPSGKSRAFHTDQFDKDFKLVFKIQRNFSPLPCFANDMRALTVAAALKA